MDRETIIRNLCKERGSCWGDGSPATPAGITDAAKDPAFYGIDVEDLDAVVRGDVAATVRLRLAWGLPPFC